MKPMDGGWRFEARLDPVDRIECTNRDGLVPTMDWFPALKALIVFFLARGLPPGYLDN